MEFHERTITIYKHVGELEYPLISMASVIYVSTGDNKLAAVEVDSNGDLVRILQVVEPVVDPLPPTLPENAKGALASGRDGMDITASKTSPLVRLDVFLE